MSENGLIDFKDRGNFEFLKFRFAQEYEKQELKADCQRIMQYAHDTVKDLCLLGLRLKELKESGLWKEVYDEKSSPFSYVGFEEFCKYAFGFSQTKVSNLTRIGEFVKLNGANVDFIDKRYEGFSLSQLVELSSVDEDKRRYFNAEMTIEEMRSVKVYMRDSYEFIERRGEDYDIVTVAKNFRERENAKRAAQKERNKQIMAQNGLKEIVIESDQIPGQTNCFDQLLKKAYEEPHVTIEEEEEEGYEDYGYEAEPPYYDAAADIEAEKRSIEAEAERWAERIEAEESEKKSDVGSAERCREESGEEFITKYPLSVRAGRRAFLEDFSEWQQCPEIPQAEARYYWRFKDGSQILAEKKRIFTGRIQDGANNYFKTFFYVRFQDFDEWSYAGASTVEEWLAWKFGNKKG